MRGSDPALVEFRFVSRLVHGLPEAVLLRLERQSGSFNRSCGLTGEMCLDGRGLRQVIEGDWSVVMPLAARILTDRRHEAIEITAFQPIKARRFHDWRTSGFDEGLAGMGRVGEANVCILPIAAWGAAPERARIGAP